MDLDFIPHMVRNYLGVLSIRKDTTLNQGGCNADKEIGEDRYIPKLITQRKGFSQKILTTLLASKVVSCPAPLGQR